MKYILGINEFRNWSECIAYVDKLNKEKLGSANLNWHVGVAYFENEEDAIAFKLKFGL